MTSTVDVAVDVAVDVERAQKGAGGESRGRCKIACLVCSVLALYALVLAGGALGFWTLHQLRADMERSWVPTHEALRSAGTHFKILSVLLFRFFQVSSRIQNFAYVRAISSKIENEVMRWESYPFGDTDTVGSRYSYDSKQATVTVNQEGTYFLYVQLTLNCKHHCDNGSLGVNFESEREEKLLTCDLDLPETPSTPVTKKCWTVIPRLAKGSRLHARMDTRKREWKSWTIDLNQSGFGMFLVDGPGTD
ncbi:uncharacterized protein LOC134328509 [Trichomycterus rosablanca]|uniref:uncharacterized protein LOC134328509 n=1 Tax=Trichomycterus rosablanca TaxID=2290929 RepID=UPI002F3596F0